MSETRRPLPDGYEYTGRTPTEIRLIDPSTCPAGHPFRMARRSRDTCDAHGRHHSWTCGCGREVWRHDGAFVTRLQCR